MISPTSKISFSLLYLFMLKFLSERHKNNAKMLTSALKNDIIIAEVTNY